MSDEPWTEGEICVFLGKDPGHQELRKILMKPGQPWSERPFFHLDQAREAGYPDSELAGGKRIRFVAGPGPKGPVVRRFEPYAGGARPARVAESREVRGSFHNPYHFIPLKPPDSGSLEDAEAVLTGTLHDRFGRDRYCGRVLCRLTAAGPLVVGSAQTPGSEHQPRLVEPFELPDPDAPGDPERRRPAIPASTLRGLVSSLVEAASGSALRVLEERNFSRRHDVREALSAVGMIVRQGENLALLPLTLSLEDMNHREADPFRCRVLLDGYDYSRNEGKTRANRGSFLADRPESWSASNREFWYADYGSWHWHQRKGRYLGVRLQNPPITEAAWQALPEKQRASYTRGILLVLGLDGSKESNLPPTKKHEYFLPFPKEREQERPLDIPPEVLAEFERLAAAAAAIPRGEKSADLPYHHAGRQRDSGGVELSDGDLVYYERDPRSRAISRLALSAIWRTSVAGSLYGAIAKVDENLVPLRPGREALTLAERLFGFVEENEERALAGRLRFAHAVAQSSPPEGWYDEEVTLKILASPKPPSPAFYFGNNGYLGKKDLDLIRHAPQGRKVYLHHRRREVEARGYETAEPDARLEMKARVRPLRPDTPFLFHIDFTNLTRAELGYLLYALRPRERFHHKLGMGKPLGLGEVVIDPLALCYVDRSACYRPEVLFAGKYQGRDASLPGAEWERLPPFLRRRYRHEAEASRAPARPPETFPTFSELVAEARAAIPGEVRHALELVGDPDSPRAEVTYPVLQGQQAEGEHFQWFVANDNKRNQSYLKNLNSGEPLPPLPRHPPPRRH